MMERCARDLFVMMSEIIPTRFSMRSLEKMTSIPILPTPGDIPEQLQLKQGVMALLRQRLASFYRIDVESDSTIRADLTRQKQEVAQFLQGASSYFAAVAPLVQQGALPADAAVEIFAATSRMFNLGKSVEDTLEKMVTEARTKADAARKQQSGQPGAPGQPPPSPEMIKASLDAEAAKQEEGRRTTEFEARMNREAQLHDIQTKKAATELAIKVLDEELRKVELQIKRIDLANKAGGLMPLQPQPQEMV
jgi:hypothetical protein